MDDPVFQSLTHDEVAELLAKGEQIQVSAGQILFEEGDVGDAMYVIRSGGIRILTTADDGLEIVLAHRSQGAYVGEQALLGPDKRRNSTAVAIEPSQLSRIDRQTFENFLLEHGDVATRLGKVGVAQLHHKLVRQYELFKPLAELLKDESGTNWLKPEEYGDGAVVFRQGDPGDRVFLISEGFVRISRDEDGEERLLARLGKGSYFGELALINRAPRRATATAAGFLKVFSLKSEAFLSVYSQSPTLQGSMECLSSFYDSLPAGGLITFHRGKFLGKDSMTALHYSSSGLIMSATRVIGESIFTAAYLEQGKGNTFAWHSSAKPDISRELQISGNRVVGATAIGDWPDLGRIYQMMVQQRRLRRWQLALFRREGELWLEREAESFDAEAAVCKCTGVNRGTLTRAVAQGYDTLSKLAEKTGASQVCGSCAPVLAEILGHSDMALADLVGIIPVTKEVKSFRFRPRSGDVLPHLPGQHIRLEVPIGGRWIQRSYTLTSPCRQSAYYEITVKREPQGLMSCWLHDDLTEQSLVRISTPRGQLRLEAEDRSDVVCFSGGIGITPALAMLRFFAAAQPASRRLHVDYSVSDAAQVVYPDELRKAMDQPNIRVNMHISSEGRRLQNKDVAEVVGQHPGARFFICGPRSYEEAVAVFLREAGVGDERVSVERFTPAGMLPRLDGSKTLLSTSLLTVVFGFVFFCVGPLAPPASVETADFSFLWRDFLWQQISGYAVLGLGASSLLMSLRKRVSAVRRGRYAGWRMFHVGANILALALLAAHTGLSLGSHFNLMLMLGFLGLALSGGLSGGLIFLEQRLPSPALHRLKTWCQYAHIAFGWPLPALMGVHIVAAYFFGSGP